MSIHQLKDGRWYVAYWIERKQKRRYFGRGAAARDLARDFDRGCHPGRLRTGATISELFNRFTAARIGSVEHSTMRNWLWKFNAVILPALGHRPAAALTARDLDAFVARRLRSVKRTTVHADLTALQSVINWAVARGYLGRNPLAGYRKPKRDDAIIDPPRREEIERILAAAAPHLVRAIMISYFTGLRPGVRELFGLRYRDTDLDQYTILIRAAKKGGPRSRRIPLHPVLADLIATWYDTDDQNDDQFIIHYNGKPIASLKTAWRRAKQRAGITRRIRLYDLRHAGITAMLQQGVDMKTVSSIAGHSRVDTTLNIYAHTNETALRHAINTIPAVGQYLVHTKQATKTPQT